MEKLDINKMKLLLKLNADVANLNVNIGHECEKCNFKPDDDTSSLFGCLSTLEDKMCRETKMSLVHMAGYVTRNDAEESEDDLLEVTTFYFQKYGDYTKKLDRGCLKHGAFIRHATASC